MAPIHSGTAARWPRRGIPCSKPCFTRLERSAKPADFSSFRAREQHDERYGAHEAFVVAHHHRIIVAGAGESAAMGGQRMLSRRCMDGFTRMSGDVTGCSPVE